MNRATRGVLRPAPADDRHSGGGGDVCQVPRCGGAIHAETDGNGRLRAWCVRCADRIQRLEAAQQWVRELARRRDAGASLSDERLAELVRERFVSPREIARGSSVRRTLSTLARERKILAILAGTRGCLVSRAAAAKWQATAAASRGKIGELIRVLPRQAPGLTVREISAAIGASTAYVAPTLYNLRPALAQHLKRTGVRKQYRYFWTGPDYVRRGRST